MSSTKADDFGIDSIQVKLMRADKHLAEALTVLDGYKRGECAITMEKDASLQMAVQRVRLSPAASPEISAIAGDFFSNVRAALDYIIWQIVTSNPPNEPGANNQFPIAATRKEYEEQISRKRLRGVPEAAANVIERLQPYNNRANPLGILNRLVNIDKHRTLNVVTVVADNTEVTSQSGNLTLMLGDEELRDGSVFGGIGIPFAMIEKLPDFERRLPTMKMRGFCSLFVAFDDPTAEELEDFRVDRTLERILSFVRQDVLVSLEPFLR